MKTYLKDVREKKNVSQTEIARLINVSKTVICRFEKGTRLINLEQAKEIADFLGVTIDTFVYEEKFKELDDNAKT